MAPAADGDTRRYRKVADLEISQVVDGYVVYDPERNLVHYLNHTAAVVLELCDGELDVDRIVEMVGAAWDLPDPPVAEVASCIDRLAGVGLVVEEGAEGAEGAGGTAPRAADPEP